VIAVSPERCLQLQQNQAVRKVQNLVLAVVVDASRVVEAGSSALKEATPVAE